MCIDEGIVFSVMRLSLFLDLDGTLIDLAEHPEAVSVPARLPLLLQQLDHKLGGALAIASGRNIAVLDRLLLPYQGSAIGVHGVERRLHAGAISQHAVMRLPVELRDAVADLVRQYPGAFIEDKGSAIAVHDRSHPVVSCELAEVLRALCAEHAPEWQCLSGNRVVEVKPVGIDKGSGVDWLMRASPFAESLPVAIGDDFTDLDMFAAVRAYGGLTVAVGERIAGDGQVHLHSPAAVLRLLESWATLVVDYGLANIEALARQADIAQ